MSVNAYFDGLDPPVREVAEALRKLIKDFSPQLCEQIKWNSPTYSLKKNICAIMAHRNHVNLQLFQGAHIDDADELEGVGKDMRHCRYHALTDIDAEAVKRYLQQAVAIDQ